MTIIMPRILTTRADVDITVSSRGVGSMHQADRRPSDETSRKTSKTTKTPPWRAASGEDSIITTSTTTMTPFPRNAPVAHFGLFDLAPAQPSSSDSYRRVKSANAGVVRRRQRHSASMQRSLSHSSSNSRTIHPFSASQQTVPFLPIPPRKSDATDDGSRPRINTAEESDLARMYDYATWNMYERIVSARRKRIAQIELEKQQQLEAEVKDKEEEKSTTAESQGLKDNTEDKKKKNCQEDGSITTAAAIRVVADATTAAPSSKREQHPQGQRGKSTFDTTCTTVSSATESYRDSSSTSSWSGADSPLPIAPFQNFTTNDEEVMKSTMSRYDSFIFELDM